MVFVFVFHFIDIEKNTNNYHANLLHRILNILYPIYCSKAALPELVDKCY